MTTEGTTAEFADAQFGRDEWAARERRRSAAGGGARGMPRLQRVWRQADTRYKWLVAVALAAAAPLVLRDAYLMRVAGLTGLYMILALGLNVIAGLAGLLDLGYVAFYGLGAYTFALLASPQFSIHWPFLLILPVAIAVTALFGLLLGFPSLRLRGDYLAIVTLGFGQIVGLLFLNFDRLNLPFVEGTLNITGGPNGIIQLDDISFLGLTVRTVTGYYYVILALLALVFVAVYHLDQSRIGRAWRAIREDELAAQSMGVNVRAMKLLAYAIGAGIAGLAGVLFAAWQGAVFPPNFDVSILIILYSMVVLGGVGNLWGAVGGALILSILPELLRSPGVARLLFYTTLGVSLLAPSRHRRRGLLLLLGVIVLGLLVRGTLYRVTPEWFTQPEMPASAARSVLAPLIHLLNGWMVHPRDARTVGNVAFVLTVVALLTAARLKGAVRYVLLVPALYGLTFVWETRLINEPSVTRMLILGVLLVLIMNYRPQGLLGQKWIQKQ